MFRKPNREIEALETRVRTLEDAHQRLLSAWEKEQLDLSDIKQQVLRTLNRLISYERRGKKSPENGPGEPIEEPRPPNPLALGILQRRR